MKDWSQRTMKFKHNKKRNTAFLFECLVRELTKAALNEDQGREKNILALIKEYFSKGTVLHEELNLYKSLKPDSDISLGIAEKLLYEVKIDYSSLDKKKVFSAQSSLIKKINKDFSKNIFSNFVPNYKSLATIYQILNPGKLNAKSRIILEEQFLKDMTSKQTLTENKIEKLDNFTVKTFINKFNNEYSGKLLKEQKELIGRFITSFQDNGVEMKIYVNEELGRIKNVLREMVENTELETAVVHKTKKVLNLFETFKEKEVDLSMVEIMLKTQKLIKEIQSDGKSNS